MISGMTGICGDYSGDTIDRVCERESTARGGSRRGYALFILIGTFDKLQEDA